MKKLISILLVIAMLFALASCAGKDEKTEDVTSQKVEDKKDNSEKKEDASESEEKEEAKKEETEEKKEENKAEENKKPSSDETSENPPVNNETQQPAEEEESNKSVAYTLADVFKANASSDLNTIANKLIADSSVAPIGASLATMEVEEGYLTGFDNEEIKGFKSGVMFAPMMGTIPFVGYVFELESADSVSAFVSKLKGAGNLRWNICTSADEMVVTSVGSKVFFVMCPLSFEE